MTDRRGFLGALLAAPLAILGWRPSRIWRFRAAKHSSKPRELQRYTVTSWTDGASLLRKGDVITISGVWIPNE